MRSRSWSSEGRWAKRLHVHLLHDSVHCFLESWSPWRIFLHCFCNQWEKLLEGARRCRADEADGLVGKVGERVRCHSRHTRHISGMELLDLSVHVEGYFTFRHVEGFVGHAMAMQRGLHPGVRGEVDHRPFPAGLRRGHFHDCFAELQVVNTFSFAVRKNTRLVPGF